MVLGGHTFISQLGSDPAPDTVTQRDIVETCLQKGIRWFDTTYQPERVALGKALRSLNARDQAVIIAWNFFRTFTDGEEVGSHEAYQPGHLDVMLAELETSYLDCLVVHHVDDIEQNRVQINLAGEWKRQGRVHHLGYWIAPGSHLLPEIAGGPFEFIVQPNNITTPSSTRVFSAAKQAGLQTFACSPYVRGWELDVAIQRAIGIFSWSKAEARARLADYFLRYSLFTQDVDRIIVSVRRVEWIESNIVSVKRGHLTPDEQSLLKQIQILDYGS